ncbi:hypothetical protein O181_080325 [Austropuccinia psidii MF-1]|uniref:Uncharacterized protein n=1 Tax=Austropuccinia psidii MF-1 TaxID=1389203 RepID=A0A9Q3IIS3_9BASI|nr:hypothetical protein [Austropuccinia psidii MF-1]
MLCTLCTKWGIPCICSLITTDACDACKQAHQKCLFVVFPFPPRRQRSSCARCPCKDSFVVNNDGTISKHKLTPGPQAGRRERFWMSSPVPSSIDFSTHHPMVTSLLDRSEVIIWPMKDCDGKRTFKLGLIVTMPCHQWDSKAKNKTHRIPPNKTLPFLVCLASKPHGNPLQSQVPLDKPSRMEEPPIPGPSPSSQPPEDVPTREPEPEVAPMQSMEEPFAHPATPCLIIIIADMPIGSPLLLP